MKVFDIKMVGDRTLPRGDDRAVRKIAMIGNSPGREPNSSKENGNVDIVAQVSSVQHELNSGKRVKRTIDESGMQRVFARRGVQFKIADDGPSLSINAEVRQRSEKWPVLKPHAGESGVKTSTFVNAALRGRDHRNGLARDFVYRRREMAVGGAGNADAVLIYAGDDLSKITSL